MRITHILAAAGLALAAALSGAAASAASAPLAADPVGNPGIILVQRDDCHENVRRHYLPEYGRRVEHYHRGRSCRAVIVEDEGYDEPRDCHRDPQRHYVRELGRSVWHRHVGPRCRVDTMREYRGDRRDEGCVRAGPVTICP